MISVYFSIKNVFKYDNANIKRLYYINRVHFHFVISQLIVNWTQIIYIRFSALLYFKTIIIVDYKKKI